MKHLKLKTFCPILIVFIGIIGLAFYLWKTAPITAQDEIFLDEDQYFHKWLLEGRENPNEWEVYLSGKSYRYKREALTLKKRIQPDGYIREMKSDDTLTHESSNFLRVPGKEQFSFSYFGGYPYYQKGNNVVVFFANHWHIFKEN